ncbi:MAG: putative DNA-binding domain-containing protein, partial [Thiotrichaceae bacterium]|nr:putative DNA-binding domain-containing protein [Thiotrichaceae bacterium]
MDIKTFQGDFINAIFGGDKAPAVSHVIGDDTLTAEQRFGIYSGSVHGILAQALGVMFPICKTLVGDAFFDKMCKIFIDQNPPDTSFFAEYGAQLPEFINTFEHVKDLPYLHDVARLEWVRQIIWHEEA